MMKLISTFATLRKMTVIAVLLSSTLISINTTAQISLVCTDPSNIIYGLTGNGLIYEINLNTAATGSTIKNGTYSGNSPNSSNVLGYNYKN
jgi:hypothetical protein